MTMTDEQALATGKRWVARERWRWMPGMVSMPDVDGRTWRMTRTEHLDDLVPIQEGGRILRHRCIMDALVPDLRDPATRGCCLELVREAFPSRPAQLTVHERVGKDSGEVERYWVCAYADHKEQGQHGEPYRWMQASGNTEAEALTAAWEAVTGMQP